MPSYLSTLNASTTPLLAGSSFVGGTEHVLNYTCGDVSVLTDTDTQITVYGSKDQVNWAVVYNAYPIGGTPFFDTFITYHPWLYSELTNVSGVGQTLLNYQLVYRQHAHAMKITDTVAVAVLGTVPIVSNNRVSSTVFNNVVVNAGDTSSTVDLSAHDHTTLTLYGTSSGACDLTVQFSLAGTTFYSSQYTITIPVAGDFGATIQNCAKFVRLKRTDAGGAETITAICEAV